MSRTHAEQVLVPDEVARFVAAIGVVMIIRVAVIVTVRVALRRMSLDGGERVLRDVHALLLATRLAS